MRRRRRLPPDTRPKWNDPLTYTIMFGERYAFADIKRDAEYAMGDYDELPRELRDQEKADDDEHYFPI